jgi:hypothetical protein
MKKLLTFAVAAAVAAFTVPAGATVFLPFDLVSQVEASELVFEGTVELVYACPNPDGDLPRTCASVAVDSLFKGEHAPSHVTLVVPGGLAANGTWVQMVGAPSLAEGERVIASTFLTPDPQGLVGLVNFDTALLVRSVTKSGNAVALNADRRALRSLPLFGRAVLHEPLVKQGAAEPSERPLSWAAARRAIENAVAKSRQTEPK